MSLSGFVQKLAICTSSFVKLLLMCQLPHIDTNIKKKRTLYKLKFTHLCATSFCETEYKLAGTHLILSLPTSITFAGFQCIHLHSSVIADTELNVFTVVQQMICVVITNIKWQTFHCSKKYD